MTRQLPVAVQTDEREIQSLAEDDLGRLEEGMSLVDHYVPVGFGIIDTLALDRDGNPVVIEYKAAEGADESALIQGLDYASWVDKNPDTLIRFINEKGTGLLQSKPLGNVRIVLVCPNFGQRTVNAAEMIDPDISLVKYHCLEHPGIGRWLHYETVYDSRKIRPRSLSPQAYKIEDHFEDNYASMRPIFDKLLGELKKEVGEFRVYAKKYYIALQRTYMFAVLYVYQNKIQVGVMLRGEVLSGRLVDVSNWGWSRFNYAFTISKEEDVDGDVIAWLKESYSGA